MKQLALSALDCAINQYIRLSPDTITALTPLENKVFAIELTDWQLNFYMIPYNYGIQILPECDTPPNTTITSTLSSLVKMSMPNNSHGTNSNLHIQGDIQLGQQLHHILTNIDIDWEEHLSKITGDIVAHKACSLLKRIRTDAHQAATKMSRHMTTYFQTECELLPTFGQFEQFKQSNIHLRDDVERLEAKINHFLFEQKPKDT